MRALLVAVFSLLAVVPAASARTVARCDGARLDDGVARSVSDCTPVSLAAGPTAAARDAIDHVEGALRVGADELAPVAVTHTAAGSRVRFQQYADGVPVHDGQVAVALAPDGAVQQIVNAASARTGLDTRARVSREEALLTARRRVPSGFDLVAPPSTKLVAEPRPGGALELAWLVVLPVREPRGDWNVVVSARSGEVLDAYDTLKRDTGTTRTFAPNPVQTTGDTDLRNSGSTTPGSDAFVDLQLFDLDPGTKLVGTYADLTAPGVEGCTTASTYTPGSASSATRSYSYTRNDSRGRFEETVAYAAIDGVMRDIGRLGLTVPFRAPVPVNVHCVTYDNSYFSSGDHALHFGDGGVDDAEDADVIVHELGHAIQDAQVEDFGPGGEQSAIGEGFGDLLAAFTYLGAGNADYQATRRFCVMEWDATSYNPVITSNPGSGCQRWVDGTDESTGADVGVYRGTPSADPHADGRYWSAMMTCVYEGIPATAQPPARDRVLTLAIAQTSHLPPTAANGAFADSVTALREEDRARFAGEDIALINRCARARLGEGAVQDATPPVVNGGLTPAAPDGANGWYRTAPSVAWQVSDPDTEVVTSGCGPGTDPADTQGRTITCTATSRGGVTVKTLSYRKDAKAPSLLPVLDLVTPRVGQDLDVEPGAVDGVSGIASQSCDTPSTAHRGPHTIRCRATDNAGNVAEQSVSYTVGPRQRFTGRGASVLRSGDVRFRLRSNAGGRVRITAKAGSVRFRKQTVGLREAHTKRVTLRLSKSGRRAFSRKLRARRRVRVKVTLTPLAGGGKRHLTLKVRR